MKKKVLVTILVLICIIGILILGYHIKRHNQNEEDPYGKEAFIEDEIAGESRASNAKFEKYFGTDVTANEVDYLLSEVNIHNSTASRNEELSIIGICFVANNVETDEEHGIYQKISTDIDSTKITKKTYNDYNFSSDLEKLNLIKSYLNPEATYTINVPNTKVWNLDKQKNTGFEKDGNPLGAIQIGSTGGYYSSDYMRLIYIIENPKQ